MYLSNLPTDELLNHAGLLARTDLELLLLDRLETLPDLEDVESQINNIGLNVTEKALIQETLENGAEYLGLSERFDELSALYEDAIAEKDEAKSALLAAESKIEELEARLAELTKPKAKCTPKSAAK